MFRIFELLIFLALAQRGLSLMCYKCAPSMPGCDEFNWRGMGYLGTTCPEDDDICVKLIEKKGAEVRVTRECLSSLEAIRTDFPTDRYEGCKHSSPDIRLAHYVNTSIKQYDVKRNHYDETIWCLCKLDHRCNGSTSVNVQVSVIAVSTLVLFLIMLLRK